MDLKMNFQENQYGSSADYSTSAFIEVEEVKTSVSNKKNGMFDIEGEAILNGAKYSIKGQGYKDEMGHYSTLSLAFDPLLPNSTTVKVEKDWCNNHDEWVTDRWEEPISNYQ